MIISRQKEFKEIIRTIKERNIFIIGCGKCATKLHVGGEPEVHEMGKKLSSSGKNIVGWTILSSACNINSWKDVQSQNPSIKKAEAILVMSCGGGTSVLSGLSGIPMYPALDTESLGGFYKDEIKKDQCSTCGDCTVWMYGGICPLTQCAKSLLNGPCGGVLEGKCEVDERICAWDEIFERLKKLEKLEYLKIIHEPKNHANMRSLGSKG